MGMIILAVIIDVLGLLLGGGLFGFVVDIPAAIIFGVFFLASGVKFSFGRVLGFMGTIVLEFLPSAGFFWWTLNIVYNVRAEWKRPEEAKPS